LRIAKILESNLFFNYFLPPENPVLNSDKYFIPALKFFGDKEKERKEGVRKVRYPEGARGS